MNASRERRVDAKFAGDFNHRQWEEVKAEQEYRCAECGVSEGAMVYGANGGNPAKKRPVKLTRDHILPIAAGGKHTKSNVQALCWRCNQEKKNKII